MTLDNAAILAAYIYFIKTTKLHKELFYEYDYGDDIYNHEKPSFFEIYVNDPDYFKTIDVLEFFEDYFEDLDSYEKPVTVGPPKIDYGQEHG